MDSTAYVAVSRAIALDREMTAIANNLANAETGGYRAQHTLFETVLERSGPPAERTAFVQDRTLLADPGPLPLLPTGNPFDLAVDGDAYLQLQTPEGRRFVSGANLVVDGQGRLVTTSGHQLLDDNGGPMTVPANPGRLTIAEDGTVSATGGPIGRIGLVRFTGGQPERQGDGLLKAASGEVPAGEARVRQGFLAGSNVKPVIELARMIETQRAFEGSLKMIETHHDLTRRVIERVGSLQA